MEKSELVLKPDGSVYHLALFPHEIADDIILVGDPERSEWVSGFFDKIEVSRHNREIISYTGYYKNKRFTVISTGMGTDNIDIVVNELDALANIDLEKREIKKEHKSLNLIRIGTSGALHSKIDVNSVVISEMALGMDGLLHYYKHDPSIREVDFEKNILQNVNWPDTLPKPYVVKGDSELYNKLYSDKFHSGVTVTASGFYGPQGRVLRLPLAYPELINQFENFEYQGHILANFEMETSALFGLAKLMGHQACTVCVAIANRVTKDFTDDYSQAIKNLVLHVLNSLVK